jgi:zinc transporter ZupT
MVVGMDSRTATPRVDGLSLTGVIRGFAEGSLVGLGFALAILAIGTPLALLVRGVHEGLSWLVRLRGETSALMDAFVSVSSILGVLILVAVFTRLLVGFLQLAAQVSHPREQ